MKTKSADYQELEIIYDTTLPHKSNKQILLSWLVHLSKFLAKALIQMDELQIWRNTTRQGDVYWKVYNPATGQTSHFGSEAEVLNWIEQRY